MCTSMTRGVKAEEGHPRPTRIYTRYSSTSPTLAWLQLVAHPVGLYNNENGLGYAFVIGSYLIHLSIFILALIVVCIFTFLILPSIKKGLAKTGKKSSA